MSSIQIDTWLQDAIDFQLKEHVVRVVTGRIPKDVMVDKWFNVKIQDIDHSYGFVNVSWSYQTNNRAPSTRENGTESFTLAEVLRICMTDRKEKE